MKKKILLSCTVVAIVALAAFNLNFNVNTDSRLSIINLDNIEALAQNENDQGVSKIVITQTGSSYACIDGVGYKVVSYNRACEGEGDFECTPGNYSVYTPSSQGCGGA